MKETLCLPCGIGNQGSETNKSLWALLGLKTYPNNITPSQAGGRDWKTIRQKLEDEKKMVQSRGWVGLRQENRYGMESLRDMRRRRDHSNFFECVCTGGMRMRAHSASLFRCVCDQTVCFFLSLCVCLSEHLCASVCVCRLRPTCMYVWWCGGEEGQQAGWGEEERHDINNGRGL